MSEIEKMYENAGIEPIAEYCKHQCNNEFDDNACIGCKHIEKVEFPPFTAEKQINLTQKLWKLKPNVYPNFDLLTNYSYSEMIAELANHLWQDLTEEEKTSIKNILEK